MDTHALQLAARFSLAPNSLGYCGRDSAPQKFIRCVGEGECSGVETELTKFIVLYPYLSTISRITGLPEFSRDVIEAYWLGNDVLKKAKPKDYPLLLEAFTRQGVPEWLVTELAGKPPDVFIPNHLFQVLHVGVGRASGSVPFSIESINNCMIRWGKVAEVAQDHVTVHLNSVEKTEGRYAVINQDTVVPLSSPVVKELKKDDTVAVHWKMIVKKLTKREEQNLSFWTQQICSTLQ